MFCIQFCVHKCQFDKRIAVPIAGAPHGKQGADGNNFGEFLYLCRTLGYQLKVRTGRGLVVDGHLPSFLGGHTSLVTYVFLPKCHDSVNFQRVGGLVYTSLLINMKPCGIKFPDFNITQKKDIHTRCGCRYTGKTYNNGLLKRISRRRRFPQTDVSPRYTFIESVPRHSAVSAGFAGKQKTRGMEIPRVCIYFSSARNGYR